MWRVARLGTKYYQAQTWGKTQRFTIFLHLLLFLSTMMTIDVVCTVYLFCIIVHTTNYISLPPTCIGREECWAYCNCKWGLVIWRLYDDVGQASILLNWNKTECRPGPVAGGCVARALVIRSTVCSHWTTLPLRPVHCPFPSSHPASQPLPATHWASRPNYSDQSYNWDQPVPAYLSPPPPSSPHIRTLTGVPSF